MKRRIVIGALAAAYLVAMAGFAFRPFRPISGTGYVPAMLEWKDGAVHVQRDASLEDRRNVSRIRDALVESGQISLAVVLKTDSFEQPDPALIFGLSRDYLTRNFSLDQDGNAIELRLRTTETDHNGMRSSLLVPNILDPKRKQHLVVTYDGSVTRLYVDGGLRSESDRLRGDFSNWGRNHALVIGDEPNGGYAWSGCIWHLSVYGRALGADEVEVLCNGGVAPDALASYDFANASGYGKKLPRGLEPLRYRNLFVSTDAAAYDLDDCLFNIVGFVPLGIFVYLMLPMRVEQRKIIAVIVLPMATGLAAGATIELLQRYIATRVPCAPDILYNVTGALLGGLLGWLAFSTFEDKSVKGDQS